MPNEKFLLNPPVDPLRPNPKKLPWLLYLGAVLILLQAIFFLVGILAPAGPGLRTLIPFTVAGFTALTALGISSIGDFPIRKILDRVYHYTRTNRIKALAIYSVCCVALLSAQLFVLSSYYHRHVYEQMVGVYFSNVDVPEKTEALIQAVNHDPWRPEAWILLESLSLGKRSSFNSEEQRILYINDVSAKLRTAVTESTKPGWYHQSKRDLPGFEEPIIWYAQFATSAPPPKLENESSADVENKEYERNSQILGMLKGKTSNEAVILQRLIAHEIEFFRLKQEDPSLANDEARLFEHFDQLMDPVRQAIEDISNADSHLYQEAVDYIAQTDLMMGRLDDAILSWERLLSARYEGDRENHRWLRPPHKLMLYSVVLARDGDTLNETGKRGQGLIDGMVTAFGEDAYNEKMRLLFAGDREPYKEPSVWRQHSINSADWSLADEKEYIQSLYTKGWRF